MSVKRFQKLVRSEKAAFSCFRRLVWKNYRKFCTRCKAKKVYVLADGRYRCGRCGYTFNDFNGRWLSFAKISSVDWMWIIKLFCLELSTRKIANEVGVSYPVAQKAVDAIRASIIVHGDNPILKGNIEMDESYFGGRRKGNRGRGAAGKVPVFGILERNGRVSTNIVPDVSAETLLSLTVKKVRRGSIIYTDKWKSYDSLMFCGYRHLKVDHDTHFSQGKVHINGLEGFWSFAKERLAKHHGISPRKFPLYLKEMEFRYNNRDKDIFEILLKYITKLVPKR